MPLNSRTGVKTAWSSLARGHMAEGGGGRLGGTQSWDPGPPPWVRGPMYKKKVLQYRGLNPHTAAATREEVLPPPPPQNTPPRPPKKQYPSTGAEGLGGSKSKNSFGDHFTSQNDDSTRGYLGYPPRMAPKGGEYGVRACP